MNSEMIYIRPETLEEAVRAIEQAGGGVAVVAGGSFDCGGCVEADMLIDLQNLRPRETTLTGEVAFGPADTLRDLEEQMESLPDFQRAATAEAGLNVRNTLSLLHFLKVADGRSPLLVSLCAMDVSLLGQPGETWLTLDEYLRIRQFQAPVFWSDLVVKSPLAFGFEFVARSPLDKPIVAIGLSVRMDGSYRVALGGGEHFLAARDFGADDGSIREWVREQSAGVEDAWASAPYRQEVALVLVERLLERVPNGQKGGDL